jgi:hypothetical protein
MLQASMSHVGSVAYLKSQICYKSCLTNFTTIRQAEPLKAIIKGDYVVSV